jgi:hypothetical protein
MHDLTSAPTAPTTPHARAPMLVRKCRRAGLHGSAGRTAYCGYGRTVIRNARHSRPEISSTSVAMFILLGASSTMTRYRFRLLNVFAESPLSGNALCVFEDGRGLSDEQMQGLALQFNLSETKHWSLPKSWTSLRGVSKARADTSRPSLIMSRPGRPRRRQLSRRSSSCFENETLP